MCVCAHACASFLRRLGKWATRGGRHEDVGAVLSSHRAEFRSRQFLVVPAPPLIVRCWERTQLPCAVGAVLCVCRLCDSVRRVPPVCVGRLHPPSGSGPLCAALNPFEGLPGFGGLAPAGTSEHPVRRTTCHQQTGPEAHLPPPRLTGPRFQPSEWASLLGATDLI